MSRRKFLGWIGLSAGTGAVTLAGKAAQAASVQPFAGHPEGMGVLHDSTRCLGCRQCEAACNKVNSLPEPDRPFDDLTVLNEHRRTHPGAYTVVNKYQPPSSPAPVFVKTQCNHCLEPACASACFVKAFKKQKNGPVVYFENLCVGCRYCMIACPFYVPTYEYDRALTPRVRKCTLCADTRLAKGQIPGCVEACPREAMTFGRREDLMRLARERMARYPGRYVNHIYGEKEMGGTSWLYLSGVPFDQLGFQTGLPHKAAGEFTSGALAAVPVVVGLWTVFLTGIYSLNKRRDKIAAEELAKAVLAARLEKDEEAGEKLLALSAKLEKEKEKAVMSEVKKALAEAEKKAAEEKAKAQQPGETPEEES
ncbi:MAG: sulfate respiration complex iron-sulfur protein HmcB [Pseudomonadota bacterium]